MIDRILPASHEAPLGPWPGRHVEVGGFRLFDRTLPDPERGAGAGEPAVFVHGLGGAATNWTDLQYLLADRLDGHAIDLPGFGFSDPPPDRDYRLGTHAKAVTAFIDEHVGAPVHLFGNSMGGAIATSVAARRPDLVRTLTLVSPALPDLRPRLPGDPRLLAMLVPGIERVVGRRIDSQQVTERARAVMELCYADRSRIHSARLAAAEEELARRLTLPWSTAALIGSTRGLVRSFLGRGEKSLWRQARRVTAPTLLIFGIHDALVSVDLAPKAGQAFRDARVMVLGDCGHVAQMERPDVVATAVSDLLDSTHVPV